MSDSPAVHSPRPRRGGRVLTGLAWAVAVLLVILAILYTRLLMGPIPLNFMSERAQAMVAGVVEDGFSVQWDEFGVSLAGPISPVFRLGSVQLVETESGAEINMTALEIGVSPFGAMQGRPGANVRLVEPHFQMVQDLLGPRLSRFTLVDDERTGELVVEIHESEHRTPVVLIEEDGLSLAASDAEESPERLRSDNDWLVHNAESMNATLADLADQAVSGQINRLDIVSGTVGLLDTVYGRYKQFDNLQLEARMGREPGRVSAIFEADIAGRTMQGTLVRRLIDGVARIEADVENLDFASLIAFIDDADGIAALRGGGTMAGSIDFSPEDRKVLSGRFMVDLTGTHLRLNTDLFPVQTEPFAVGWAPDEARFHFEDVDLRIGQSAAMVTGDVVLGFDRQFGPTLGMSIRARDVHLQPDDLDAPEKPFDAFSFEGWSAPLYGAIGIDRLVGARDNVSVLINGRLDLLREGIGLDLNVRGRGASADDLKRLWPYIFATEAREQFVEYVNDGKVETADMRFNFPVGTLSMDGEDGGPVPDGAMTIELVGNEIELQPFEGIPQFEVDGTSRVSVRDNQFTMSFERAVVIDEAGTVEIANAAFLNQDTSAAEQVFEISGDISGTVPTLVEIANREPFELLEDIELGIDIDQLASDISGDATVTVIATIANDEAGRMTGTDYALNGTVSQLRSLRPIGGFSFEDARLAFTASQEGFRVTGAGEVEEVPVELQVVKSGNAEPEITLATAVDVARAASFGVDLSEFVTGQVRVAARPMPDGTFQLTADLADAALTLSDIGVSKDRGTPGTINAVVAPGEERISISDISLGFGSVRLMGDVAIGYGGELHSADFSTFQISPGDSARVSMTPTESGFALSVAGEQLDIKPVLKRFFNLEGDQAAGPSSDLEDQIFDLNVRLDRALGYYGTVALNLDLDLSIRGDELRRVNLSGQLGGGRAVSATTNPQPGGRTITYVSNDVGGLLRFVGVYPRLVGGNGSLVMRHDAARQLDTGEFVLRDFAIVDEANMAQIVGSHADSRRLISRGNTLNFSYGRAEFVRTSNYIEVIDGALYGNAVGGTVRGNILTSSGQYDLAGTYVPLFGLNNAFQQIPILGPIFGGREGEGLLGVTFAVRGPLDQPDLLINPVSILAPGVFRTLFEYRAANGISQQ